MDLADVPRMLPGVRGGGLAGVRFGVTLALIGGLRDAERLGESTDGESTN